MNKKLIYYFIFALVSGTTIYLLQFFSVQLPKIINNYFNDFLIIPIVLFLSLIILRWSKNNSKFTLNLAVIIYVCLLYGLLFEYIFPRFLVRYTSDFFDVILYFLSGFIFYFLQTKSIKK